MTQILRFVMKTNKSVRINEENEGYHAGDEENGKKSTRKNKLKKYRIVSEKTIEMSDILLFFP